jgi:hypothetical protein
MPSSVIPPMFESAAARARAANTNASPAGVRPIHCNVYRLISKYRHPLVSRRSGHFPVKTMMSRSWNSVASAALAAAGATLGTRRPNAWHHPNAAGVYFMSHNAFQLRSVPAWYKTVQFLYRFEPMTTLLLARCPALVRPSRRRRHQREMTTIRTSLSPINLFWGYFGPCTRGVLRSRRLRAVSPGSPAHNAIRSVHRDLQDAEPERLLRCLAYG